MQRILKKTSAIILVITIMFTVSAVDFYTFADEKTPKDELTDSKINSSLKDYSEYYTLNVEKPKVYKQISFPIFEVVTDCEVFNYNGMNAAKLAEGSVAQIKINVAESGLYNLGFTYCPIKGDDIDINVGLKIDGEYPFEELSSNNLNRVWKDSEVPGESKDTSGNDILPKLEEVMAWNTVWLADLSGVYTEPYLIYLDSGEHVLTIEANRQSFALYSVDIGVKPELPTFKEKNKEYKKSGVKEIKLDNPIVLEAEKTHLKSSANLIAKTDYSSPTTTPYSPSKVRLNTIGGASFSDAGQWIEWKTNVKETGLYRISFRCRQNYLSGAFVTRKLYINGEIPYSELSNIKISYSSDWQLVTIENPVLLNKGENILRLEVAMGDISSIAGRIEEAVAELNYAYRQIIMVTGVNPDKYRNYELEVYVPEVIEIFKKYQKVISECNDELIALTGKRGSTNGILQTTVALLEKMNNKVYDIQNNLSVFKDDIASLSTWVSDIKNQALEIDKIYIYDSEYKLPKSNAGFFTKLKHEILAFIATFTEDYSSIGVVDNESEKIEVWIATGRDQANILGNLITEYFSPKYNVAVDLKLVQGQLLAAAASGTGPDVALQLGNGEPINYALRNAVLDLTQFEGFAEVKNRFYDSALVPFEMNGGVYALPETQTFPVMFIRTDIFEELSLNIPKDWNEFLNVVGRLQKKNMTGGITPLTNVDESSMAIFLLQNGGEFYNETATASALDSNEAIEAFKKLTSLFTDYSFPTQYSALNRFRSGEMPILINDYTLYSQLVVGAPEIDGLWEMYTVPGTFDSNGVLNTQVASTGSACMILSTTKKPEKSWDFIEWWTGSEAQSNYGRNMELLLGASARHFTANKEAFSKIAWDKDEYNILLKQWETVEGIPQVAGGYFTPRHLNNAFRRVLNQKQDPKETLLLYVKNINDEINYKRNELGMK